MPWIAIISVIVIISIIQTTLLPYISILGTQPDLFIIFLVYVSLNYGFDRSFYANWAIGLSKDLFSEGPFGLSTLMFVITGYFVSIIREEIFRKHLLTQILVTFIITSIYNFMYIFVLSISLSSTSMMSVWWKCPIVAIYNSLLVLPAFWLFNKLDSSLGVTFVNRKK